MPKLAQKINATSLLSKIDSHINDLVHKINVAQGTVQGATPLQAVKAAQDLSYKTKQQIQNLRALKRHLETEISIWSSPRVDRYTIQSLSNIESAFDFGDNVRFSDVQRILKIKTW